MAQILGQEWLILIFIAIILLFGTKKLPELARSLGKAKGEFEKGRREIERELKEVSKPMNLESGGEDSLLKIAKELGIKTEGKTGKEIREEIIKMVKEKR